VSFAVTTRYSAAAPAASEDADAVVQKIATRN
jgi:hypothetical protein